MQFNHILCPTPVELESSTTNKGRWYTTPSGNKYASVTTILGAKEKPAIAEWRASLGHQKADKETKRCSDRGESLHLMAELYLKNAENPTKNHEIVNIKMFNQLKFKLNEINNIRAQEIPLFSNELKIAGRVDCVATFDGVLSIIDFKTSNNNKNDSMVHDYKLQCTMYALCWFEMFGVLIENFVILIAVEKGLTPMVYRGNTMDYVVEAKRRIDEFYKNNGE